MATLVDIRWNMTEASSDNDGAIARNWTTLLPPWSLNDGEAAAASICEDYLTDEIWRDQFGLDDDSADVRLTIVAPKEIAGTYHVALRRRVVARAEKLESAS